MWKGKRKSKYSAKKVVVGGVTFDSELEKTCYDLLIKFKIPFKFQVEYELQPPFRNRHGKAIRRIYMVIDFVIPLGKEIIVLDTKGFATTEAKLKYKMLEYKLHRQQKNYTIVFKRTKKEVKDYVINLYDKLKTNNYVK